MCKTILQDTRTCVHFMQELCNIGTIWDIPLQLYTCNKLIFHIFISVLCLYYWPIENQSVKLIKRNSAEHSRVRATSTQKRTCVHIFYTEKKIEKKEKSQAHHCKWMTAKKQIVVKGDFWPKNKSTLPPIFFNLFERERLVIST